MRLEEWTRATFHMHAVQTTPESSARLRKHPYCPAPPTERRRAFVQTLVQVSEVRPECGCSLTENRGPLQHSLRTL